MYFVRTASERDLPAVRRLLVETWRVTCQPIYGEDRAAEISDALHSLDALRKRLATPASEFLVADSGRDIAGMAFASMTEKNVATLHQLYVLPEKQGQGIGRDLFAEVETCFDTASLLRIEIEAANAGALEFCKRHGFVEMSRQETSGIAAAETVLMEKPLI